MIQSTRDSIINRKINQDGEYQESLKSLHKNAQDSFAFADIVTAKLAPFFQDSNTCFDSTKYNESIFYFFQKNSLPFYGLPHLISKFRSLQRINLNQLPQNQSRLRVHELYQDNLKLDAQTDNKFARAIQYIEHSESILDKTRFYFEAALLFDQLFLSEKAIKYYEASCLEPVHPNDVVTHYDLPQTELVLRKIERASQNQQGSYAAKRKQTEKELRHNESERQRIRSICSRCQLVRLYLTSKDFSKAFQHLLLTFQSLTNLEEQLEILHYYHVILKTFTELGGRELSSNESALYLSCGRICDTHIDILKQLLLHLHPESFSFSPLESNGINLRLPPSSLSASDDEKLLQSQCLPSIQEEIIIDIPLSNSQHQKECEGVDLLLSEPSLCSTVSMNTTHDPPISPTSSPALPTDHPIFAYTSQYVQEYHLWLGHRYGQCSSFALSQHHYAAARRKQSEREENERRAFEKHETARQNQLKQQRLLHLQQQQKRLHQSNSHPHSHPHSHSIHSQLSPQHPSSHPSLETQVRLSSPSLLSSQSSSTFPHLSTLSHSNSSLSHSASSSLPMNKKNKINKKVNKTLKPSHSTPNLISSSASLLLPPIDSASSSTSSVSFIQSSIEISPKENSALPPPTLRTNSTSALVNPSQSFVPAFSPLQKASCSLRISEEEVLELQSALLKPSISSYQSAIESTESPSTLPSSSSSSFSSYSDWKNKASTLITPLSSFTSPSSGSSVNSPIIPSLSSIVPEQKTLIPTLSFSFNSLEEAQRVQQRRDFTGSGGTHMQTHSLIYLPPPQGWKTT